MNIQQKEQQQIQDWLDSKIFSHYFTVDLPFNRKHYNTEQSMKFLKTIVKRFEKELVGRFWHKKPVHFVGFAELGKHKIWHWHLLLWAFQYTDEELQSALVGTRKYMDLNSDTLDIRPIDRTPYKLNSYNIKELFANKNLQLNSDRIFTSETLFYL